jgi:hypothetical protein
MIQKADNLSYDSSNRREWYSLLLYDDLVSASLDLIGRRGSRHVQ